jgi:hypothetical protein
MEKLGYVKDTDWIELLLKVPEKVPEKFERIAAMVAKRFDLRIARSKSNRELERRYGKAIFDLVNRCYSPLYGYSPLSEGQIAQYIKMYLPLVDRRMIALIVNKEDELVGVGISITSLAEALQKAKGKLFPFGWYHLLKALFFKRSTRLDFLIVAIAPEYQVTQLMIGGIFIALLQGSFQQGDGLSWIIRFNLATKHHDGKSHISLYHTPLLGFNKQALGCDEIILFGRQIMPRISQTTQLETSHRVTGLSQSFDTLHLFL